MNDSGTGLDVGGGGALAVLLGKEKPQQPTDLSSRLFAQRDKITFTLAGREVVVTAVADWPTEGLIAVPVTIGGAGCRVHLSEEMMDWLGEPFDLVGSVDKEGPLQRALLLEFVCLDLLDGLEAHLDASIRFEDASPPPHPVSVGLRVSADDATFVCRLDLTEQLAETFAEGLERLGPAAVPDLSGTPVEVILRAGVQELSLAEIKSLRPGDIVTLALGKPMTILEHKLAAPMAHRSDGYALAGRFSPVPGRPAAGVLSEAQVEALPADDLFEVAFEFCRFEMTLGEIEKLSPGKPLTMISREQAAVDVVVEDRRVGTGELIELGEGTGVRIHHLSIARTPDPDR